MPVYDCGAPDCRPCQREFRDQTPMPDTMEGKTKMHAKGEWRLSENDETLIVSADLDEHGNCTVIADVLTVEGKATKTDIANAARIVQAVNAHDELVEALKAMVDRWEPDVIGTDRVMWENAVAALARAGGGTT